MTIRPAVFVPLLLAGLGTLFVGVGLFMLLNEGPQHDAARGESLQVVTARTLGLRDEGELVLLEGRLAVDSPASFQQFVAYRRERYAGRDTSESSQGEERWNHLETVAPPLRIETPAGPIPVVNSGYELRSAPRSWRDATLMVSAIARSSERATGFFAGDSVTVEGRVVRTGAREERGLEATRLFGGDRAAYLATLRESVQASRIVGMVFVGAGGLVLGAAALVRRVLARRVELPPDNESTVDENED